MRDDSAIGSDLEAPILDLLLQFLSAVNGSDVRYCYWKSSMRLPGVLRGESDLDLVVDRRDQYKIQECLLAAGFKSFPAVASRGDPSTLSYFGYDEPSGLIIHVHLHMRLVSGDRLLSDYRLPWEGKALQSSVLHPHMPIRILDSVTEAFFLIIRAFLELRRSDPVVARRWTATKSKFEADRQALSTRVDRHSLRRRSAELLGEDLADEIAGSLYDERPLERQRSLRQRVIKRLAPYRRFNGLEARVSAAARAVAWSAGAVNIRLLHLPRLSRRAAPGGGAVVALLGVDGSGKSTSLAALKGWLGSEIDTMPIYFGTGDGRASLVLLPLKILVPLYMRFAGSKPAGSSHGRVSGQAPGFTYSVLLTLWATVLAVEKRRKLLTARRAAERGLIVIADRYPQDQIPTFNDGPLLPRLKFVPSWLRRFEANAYRLANRVPPDLVFKLVASPALITAREPTMDQDVIRKRVDELNMLEFPDSQIVCIDAEQPLDDMIRRIKHEVWRQL